MHMFVLRIPVNLELGTGIEGGKEGKLLQRPYNGCFSHVSRKVFPSTVRSGRCGRRYIKSEASKAPVLLSGASSCALRRPSVSRACRGLDARTCRTQGVPRVFTLRV